MWTRVILDPSAARSYLRTELPHFYLCANTFAAMHRRRIRDYVETHVNVQGSNVLHR